VAIGYTRPFLYPKQEQAIFCPERFSAIEASTKSGKTVGSIAWIIEKAFKYKTGQNAWWIAPVYPQADIAYRRIKQSLTPGSFTAYASPQPRIELFTGGVIWIKSADNPDSLYGEDVYDAVMDEASRNKAESWHALRSTLTATRGACRLIGNVKGRKNFFWDLARRAEKGDLPDWHYARITADDAIAAGVLDPAEIEDAKRTLPEMVFRELYMAEASDDAGNPFGLLHIEACIGPLSGRPVSAWGIDLAKSQDYLVCIGLDIDGSVSQFHRWRDVPWRDSIKRIHRIVGEDTPALVDSTGVGDPVLEELQHEHGNFKGYHFSSVGKQKLMEGLAVSIQGREISFPDGPIRAELDSYEYVTMPNGVRYSAPEGYYDDCVCALALAREQLSVSSPAASLIKYYSDEAKRQRQDPRQDMQLLAPEPETKLEDLDIFDNELTDLYTSTLAGYGRVENYCAGCHTPINDLNKVSDGFEIWHIQCYSNGVNRVKRPQTIIKNPRAPKFETTSLTMREAASALSVEET
jgi:hypothetical protein